jgi:hypothetical protein
MRKDSILSEEEKQRRTKRNQSKDPPLEDLSTIEKLRSSFLSVFPDHYIPCANIDVSDRISALVSWSQMVSECAVQFVKFYRQIDEFEMLNGDDRFILIKYNLFPLFLISKCFFYKSTHDCYSYDHTEMAEKHRRFYMLCGDTNGIRDTSIELIHLMVKVTELDPTLLSLLLPILVFSQCLSINEDHPLLSDILTVHRAQNRYTKLLWNYLVSTFGEVQASRRFTQLTFLIIRLQSTTDIIREFFRIQSITSQTLDKMEPLMETLLLIS